ncbi:transcriptional regulator, AraC family [Gloeothece citriformis PCC 7424]|uniref:Transcriptional regulator, AraC family n=1 Tax=Gloeothece citriformis (strain PCC 7424) TaxID=65393 RepID=B7KJD4_GLOC7|nr:helix-turn-helix domain-containing protein [Gloeothece citriformis]ACK72218.1 transcriptional regulator, AraC family [Gloeothece citriformis PCC 7424]
MFETLIDSIECHDVDELTEAARHWTEEYLQLGTGSLKTLIDIAQLGGIQFVSQLSNLSLRACGQTPPKTISIGIPVNCEDHLVWYGRIIPPGQVALAYSCVENYLTFLGETKFLIISVDQETLLKEAEAMGRTEIISFLEGKYHLIYPDPVALAAIKNYLQDLWQLVKISPEQAIEIRMQNLIHRDFIPLFLNLFPCDKGQNPKVSFSKRYILVRKAEEFIKDNLHDPLTLQDLYEHLQVSERTLRYSFQDCLGVSPMTYLKKQRLNGVRRELKASYGTPVKINQIAARWGFWHMGQFSQDYKKLFGEFPSQTLGIFPK